MSSDEEDLGRLRDDLWNEAVERPEEGPTAEEQAVEIRDRVQAVAVEVVGYMEFLIRGTVDELDREWGYTSNHGFWMRIGRQEIGGTLDGTGRWSATLESVTGNPTSIFLFGDPISAFKPLVYQAVGWAAEAFLKGN